MIRADAFIDRLRQAGFGMFTGVPCSYLTPFINTVIGSQGIQYVGAANEGDAVAIACGAELAGVRGVVMFQNSGLGNAVNPLTSLTATFRIPVLVITTWRGQPEGKPDEPQHELMGQITPRLLDVLEIPWELFPTSEADIPAVVDRALDHMESRRLPYGLLMQEGSAAPRALPAIPARPRAPRAAAAQPTALDARLDPDDALLAIQENVAPTDAIVATTGFTGRALYALDDRPSQLYLVGSMGCASSVGLGLALTQPQRRIVVIDGDGALLMRMGALATIGHYQPANLVHAVLDNAAHESTGGQATVSSSLDMLLLAQACGYRQAARAASIDDLASQLQWGEPGPRLLHVPTQPRREGKLPRPTITPPEVAQRFRRWLQEHPCPGALARCF